MRQVKRFLHKLLRHQHWEVGIVPHPISSFLDPDFAPVVQWMPDREPTLFRADPFMLQHQGRQLIVYEDFDYQTRIGRISTSEWTTGAFHSLAQDVLPIDSHLAYPYTLEYEQRTLCIPESALENEVAAWEFDDATNRFRKVAVLIPNLRAVDSSIFRHEGLWWLACTLRRERPNEQLFLWHANDLFGKWIPHRKNPVKRDASSARPGGTPFVHQGELYRPAQDCSQRYGSAVTINRILKLTPDQFAEETVVRIPPFSESPYPSGIHTLSAAGPVTLVDGLRYEFLPSETLQVFKRGISRMMPQGNRRSGDLSTNRAP
ncbi:MAG: hypothetical protein KDA93_00865 [Planctomycetaceae bacterium]|nr:hypothetical protein [Planctomycetaceae bacterium]